MLAAVLIYGYSALGLTILLGSIGLPVPDGFATTVAGSLAGKNPTAITVKSFKL